LGYTSKEAQVYSIPIFSEFRAGHFVRFSPTNPAKVVAAVFCLLTAIATDRLRHRYAFCIFGICVATTGYGILLRQADVPVGARYAALFLIVTGGYMTQPVTIAWLNNNMSGHYKRSVSSAMQIGFGNAGGIVASNIFITSEQPAYPTGYGTSLALIWLCGLACTAFLIGVRAENRMRDKGARDYRFGEQDADNLGDDHPHFRFTY
jgi:hypothetical protein